MFKFILQIILFVPYTINTQSPKWHIVYHTNRSFQFSAINFCNDKIGWIGGKVWDSNPPNAIRSIVLKTSNSGITWQPQVFDSATVSSNFIHDISFLDSLTGIITSKQKIYYTFDGGKSWNKHILNCFC